MVQKAPAMINLSRHAKATSHVYTRPSATRPQQSAAMALSRKKTVQDVRGRWRRVGRRNAQVIANGQVVASGVALMATGALTDCSSALPARKA